jgi:hypothetical protein
MSDLRYPENKNPGGQPSDRKPSFCLRGGCAIGRIRAQPLCMDYALHQAPRSGAFRRTIRMLSFAVYVLN